MRRVTKTLTAILVIVVLTVSIQQASAATLFSVVLSAEEVGETGWFAGYVVYGSGTYTLSISASGSQSSFPIQNVRIIVCASEEAAAGGIQSITIEGTPIATYTQGPPPYYGASGGPFSEPDYYGYNDQYIIPQLTYGEAHHPESAKNMEITVQFSDSATANSKVMFLAYGINSQGQGLKTAFSNGTLIVPTPENGVGSLIAFGVCITAFAGYKKRSSLKSLTKKPSS